MHQLASVSLIASSAARLTGSAHAAHEVRRHAGSEEAPAATPPEGVVRGGSKGHASAPAGVPTAVLGSAHVPAELQGEWVKCHTALHHLQSGLDGCTQVSLRWLCVIRSQVPYAQQHQQGTVLM
jgi:hypothetical protein